jgi:kumamolisin
MHAASARTSSGSSELLAPPAPGASFASRAGYSPSYATEASDVRPASGSVPVALTFLAPLSTTGYDRAVAYFVGHGLRARSVDPNRLSLELTGPASAVGRAFSTELLAGTSGSEPVVFPAVPPALPPWLEAEVAGAVGLNSGFTRFTFSLAPVGTSAAPQRTVVPADANEMTPGLARDLYGFSSLYNLTGGFRGATYPVGTSIAVVLWGEGYAPSDLAAFFTDPQYYPTGTFPPPTIVPYPVAGAPSPSSNALRSPDTRAVEELTLDTEWAGSMSPGATIDVVYAPDGPPPSYSPSDADLTTAFAKAISLNVSAITMSFGADESSDSALVSAWTPLLAEAQSKGITVLAATGDTGGDTTTCSGTLAPEYPASSPSVVAVGGTAVTVSRPPLGSISFAETGWNDSGGGFSTQFAAPSWQEVGSAAGPIDQNGHRGMPDVSATAADNFLYFNGTAMAAAGTSFATPLWAGLVADIDAKWGQTLGFFTPSLYHVGAQEPTGEIGVGLADVAGGANCVGSAGAGWDEVTGWGSPRAPVLYEDLLGSFVNISLSTDRTTVAPGGSVEVTAQVTNRTSGAPIANVAVDLTLAADTPLGPCVGTFGSASPTTDGAGRVTGRFAVPVCYLGEHAVVNASVTTTKLYGTGGLRLSVNLLGLVPQLGFLEHPPWAYGAYSVIVGAAAVAGAWLGRPREPSLPRRVLPVPPPGASSGAVAPSSLAPSAPPGPPPPLPSPPSPSGGGPPSSAPPPGPSGPPASGP